MPLTRSWEQATTGASRDPQQHDRARFLRYLYEDSHFRPEISGFFTSAHAQELHPRLTLEELATVLVTLRSSDLIATSKDAAQPLPARAGLTGTGLICAGHHGGDVGSWAARAATTDTTSTTTVVTTREDTLVTPAPATIVAPPPLVSPAASSATSPG